MLRVIEYFAKSLKVTQGHSKLHSWVGLLAFHWNYVSLVPFLRYSASNDGVTLKSGLEITQGHWKWYHSKTCYGFLFAFHDPILYHFQDKARYWSKIAIFFILPCTWCPVTGGPRQNISIAFGKEKLKWFGYSWWKKSLRIRLAVPTRYRRVTEIETAWRTDILRQICQSLIFSIYNYNGNYHY